MSQEIEFRTKDQQIPEIVFPAVSLKSGGSCNIKEVENYYFRRLIVVNLMAPILSNFFISKLY